MSFVDIAKAAQLIRQAEKILIKAGAKTPAKNAAWARQSAESYIIRSRKAAIDAENRKSKRMKVLVERSKQRFSFDEITADCVVWLGQSPDEKRIECDFDGQKADGSKGFFVINGAWRGRLYEGADGRLYIIDSRGTRHEPIYIVEITHREKKPRILFEETPF